MTVRRNRRWTPLAAAAALVGSGLAVGLPVARASAAPADLTSWSLTTGLPAGASAITMNLTKVSLRGPDFAVKRQNADGTFTDVTSQIAPEQDYLGTVVGDPGAAVALTRMSDGKVQGEVVFDRGGTWWFTDNAVTGTRGTNTPTYAWPNRQPWGTDLIGSSNALLEMGYDISSDAYAGYGSLAKTLDMAQLSMNEQRLPWLQDAGMTEVIGTVVIRANASVDPYVGHADLGTVQNQWLHVTGWAASAGAFPDNQVQLIHWSPGGGGVTWLNNGSRDWNFGVVGANSGGWAVVGRHEAAHSWGVNDEHGGDPEGPTIQSGNAYARWDDTELLALGTDRSNALAHWWIKPLPTYTATQIPPYAGTVYLRAQAHGATSTFNPLSVDHSVNGSALQVAAVQSTSTLGARVTVAGNNITYWPLDGRTSAIDTFTYVIRDAHGRTATGVVMVKNIPPFQRHEAESGTITGGSVTTGGGAAGDYSGTGSVALTAGAGHSVSWKVNQPAERDVSLTFLTRNGTAGSATVKVDGATPVTVSTPVATAGFEGEGKIWTPVSMTVHLGRGSHTITYSTVDVAQNLDVMTMSWPDHAPTVSTTHYTVNVAAGRTFRLNLSYFAKDVDVPHDTLTYVVTSKPTWVNQAAYVIGGTVPRTRGARQVSVQVVDASGLLARMTVTINVM